MDKEELKTKIESVIKECYTQKEVCRRIGVEYTKKTVGKVDKTIKEFNLDSSHFDTNFYRRKYKDVTKTCPSCQKEFQTKSGGKCSNTYCCQSCANRDRTHSEETRKKQSDSLKKSEKFWKGVESAKQKREDNKEMWNLIYQKRKEETKQKILNADYESLSRVKLKKRVLYEQEEKCNNCGISEWMGQPFTLELEHKDGNRDNNKRENLECLCPNCHSLTSTWRGRNNALKDKKRISDEIMFKSLIKNDFNMRQSLIEVGLTPKGGNYKRCHRLKREYHLIKNSL